MKKAVVVTGSNGGIGTAICKKLKSKDYLVIGIDLGSDVNSLDVYISLDLNRLVDNEKYRQEMLQKLLSTTSSYEIVALVNNAAKQVICGVDSLEVKDFQESMNVNVLSVFILVKALYKHISANGRIVNIGSIHAQLTKKNFLAYSTSKSALHGLTRGLAVELGEYVSVNAIAPAAIETQMLLDGFNGNADELRGLASCHPTNSIGAPKEIAELVLFLVESDIPFMNGSILTIDGGISSVLCDPA